jgi:hypothetical protein
MEGATVYIFNDCEYKITDINVNLPEENGRNGLQQPAFHHKSQEIVI